MLMKSKSLSQTLFASFVTLVIVGMLIIAGPAQGFVLTLNSSKTSVKGSEPVVFTAELTVPAGEQLPIQNLTFEIKGPETVSCVFSPNGAKLTGCKGLTIVATDTTSQSYGYGYGFYTQNYSFGYGYGSTSGTLKYTITLTPTDYKNGNYTTQFRALIDNKIFIKPGSVLEIKNSNDKKAYRIPGGGSCVTDWTCGEWSTCVNGKQDRTCSGAINYCFATGTRPEMIRSCSVTDNGLSGTDVESPLGPSSSGKAYLPKEIASQSNESNSMDLITGDLVRVVESPEFPGILFFILGIIGLSIAILFVLIARKPVVRKRRVLNRSGAAPRRVYSFL